MKLDFSNERILAVVAHPDDAELLCAGTMARARKGGAVIGICVMCKGDKGQPNKRINNLSAIRKKEMSAAAKILEAEFFSAGFSDGTLLDGNRERLALIEIFRRFKPSLVLAHSPEDYHSDHRAASALAEAASWSCASRGQKTKSPAMDSPPALWWIDTINMNGFKPEFYVDISNHFQIKEKMLACHKSQLARGNDGDFSPLMELMRLQFKARGMQSDVQAAEAFQLYQGFKRVRAW